MAINFPNSPTVGQTVVFSGVTYTWSGTFWDTSGTGNIVFNLSNVVPAGTTQSGATEISTDLVFILTTAVNSGVRLPLSSSGRRVAIRNDGLNNVRVYPAAGAQINTLGTNVAFILETLTTLEFISYTTTQWYTVNATFA
jgi:hypothetical protein